MKIAIPTASGRLAAHFGHCEQFAFVEVDPDTKDVADTVFEPPPAHLPGVLPKWLHERGAEVIIAGGMGQRARALFGEQGIDVVVGAPCDPPEALVRAYLDGELKLGDNICDH